MWLCREGNSGGWVELGGDGESMGIGLENVWKQSKNNEITSPIILKTQSITITSQQSHSWITLV